MGHFTSGDNHVGIGTGSGRSGRDAVAAGQLDQTRFQRIGPQADSAQFVYLFRCRYRLHYYCRQYGIYLVTTTETCEINNT